MTTGIHVGPKLSRKGIAEFRGAINDILASNADQATKQAALDCLRTGVKMKGGNYNSFHGLDVSLPNDGCAIKAVKKDGPGGKKAEEE